MDEHDTVDIKVDLKKVSENLELMNDNFSPIIYDVSLRKSTVNPTHKLVSSNGRLQRGIMKSQSADILAGGDASHHSANSKPEADPQLACQLHSYKYKDVLSQHTDSDRKNSTPEIEIVPINSRHPAPVVLQTAKKSFFKDFNSRKRDGEGDATCMEERVTLQEFKSSSKNADDKIVKYRFDDNYLRFVQNFTHHCEDRTNLIFDGCVFFDDDFFPRSMILTEYVPINVIAPFVNNIELQVPSSTEYCKFAPCGSTLYDYFEDYKAFSNRELILRNQVIFILSSLQCPQLASLAIDSTPVDEKSTTRYPIDRLSTWNENISSFISRHAKTLEYIQMKLTRYKDFGRISSLSKADMRSASRGTFPKLHELLVTLWDNQISTSKHSDCDSQSDEDDVGNAWMPDWLPDSADQYWISLLKSQVHGILTKLCWISAAQLGWNDVFQPIIDSNRNSLQCIHILEIEGMLSTMRGKKSSVARNGESNSFSTSNSILSCVAFSKIRKLKSLFLRKTNCNLTHLHKLPADIEELSIDDMNIESTDIKALSSFPKLKILRLANSAPATPNQFENNTDKFGVDKDVLKVLLYSRSLQELCIWRHCLELEMNASSNQSTLTKVLGKINSYLANTCKSSQKISPSEFCEWNMEQLSKNKSFLQSLEKLGFVDDECVVIHEQK